MAAPREGLTRPRARCTRSGRCPTRGNACTVALAWLLARSQVIVAIPGTLSSTHVEENIGAQNLDLSTDDLAELDSYRLSTFDARSLARRFVPPRLRRVAVSMLRAGHSLRPRR